MKWALLLFALSGCVPETGKVKYCGVAADCDPVFCLFDGGMGVADAGQSGFNYRSCVMGLCAIRCK